jgi:hypothetical protein
MNESIRGGTKDGTSMGQPSVGVVCRHCGGVMAPAVLRIPNRGDGMLCPRCGRWRRAPVGAWEGGMAI